MVNRCGFLTTQESSTLSRRQFVLMGAQVAGVCRLGIISGKGAHFSYRNRCVKTSRLVLPHVQLGSGTWPDAFSESEALDNSENINYKELWVVVQCLLQEKEALRGWRVLFRVDNIAAVHYINVRYGRVTSLEALAARLEAAERSAYYWALARHLQGEQNVIADAGSRDAGFAARWAADNFRDARLRGDLFTEVASRCGVTFDMDLFYDRAGINALAPSWRSPELSAFEATLHGGVWAHPPRSLLLSVLKLLNAALRANRDLKVALLAPEDASAPWF